MVRGRSTPVILGGHFHVTRFGMFRSRAGLALNPCQRQPVHGLPTGTGPSPHSKGDIRTAPPSRSRVQNDYSILGMLSRGKEFPSPLWGGPGVGCNLRRDPTLSSLRSDIPPHKREGKKYPLVESGHDAAGKAG